MVPIVVVTWVVLASAHPYQDPELSVAVRAKDLLGRMTLEEKVAQTLHPWIDMDPQDWFKRFNTTGVGAAYMEMCCGPVQTPPNASGIHVVRQRNIMQKLFIEGTRLGIPVTFVAETLHSGAWGGTVFPSPVNYGCSFNDSLLESSQRISALEARAIGADRGFSPVINMFPDPRYGRTAEGYGEDPHLTKRMGAAALSGLQGGSIGPPDSYLPNFNTTMVGTVKHFAGYGKTIGGINGSPADLSEQMLREIFLAPWEYLATRGMRSVMASQNMVNGRPMHANRRLLTSILRNEWGVENALVESDGGDCIGALLNGFHMVDTVEDAAIVSLEAGMDQDLGGITFPTLVAAVTSNRTSLAAVDRAAYNVLVSKFAAGLFDQPYTSEDAVQVLDAPAHRQLALEAAEQSIVLLQNNQSFLPLSLTSKSGGALTVALIGPLADDASNQLGTYSSWNRGPGGGDARVVTPKDAFTAGMARAGGILRYARGANAETFDTSLIPEAVEAAQGADVAVLVLGDTMNTCAENFDRGSLDVPGAQLQLLGAIQDTGVDVVVVLIHGRPATFGVNNTLLTNSKALLAAWLPGEEGGTAIWNAIVGKINPSGRLTQAWPRSVGHIGGPSRYLYPYQGNHQNEVYAVDGPSSALFGFGFGLSYTTFAVTSLTASPATQPASGTFELVVIVNNTGSVPGATPVQIFCNDPVSRVVRAAAFQLCAFSRTPILAPGSSITMSIFLSVKELAYWDDGWNFNGVTPGWSVDVGVFNLYASTDGFGAPATWDHLTAATNTTVSVTCSRC